MKDRIFTDVWSNVGFYGKYKICQQIDKVKKLMTKTNCPEKLKKLHTKLEVLHNKVHDNHPDLF